MSELVGPMDVIDTEVLMWLQIDNTQACCRFGWAPEGDGICCTRGLAEKGENEHELEVGMFTSSRLEGRRWMLNGRNNA